MMFGFFAASCSRDLDLADPPLSQVPFSNAAPSSLCSQQRALHDSRCYIQGEMEPFAWPAAIVVLGLAGMLVFRRPLLGFFTRTTSLALWKGKIEVSAAPQVVDQPEGAEELMKVFDNALLVIDEDAINADLKKRGLTGQLAAVPVLVRHLAATRIALHFERAYSVIWGSQLAILQHLNTVGESGAPLESLEPFYSQAAATYPQMYQQYAFKPYMGYLASQMLVEIRKDHAFITLVGREFLKWLIDEGRTLYKAG